MSMQRRAAALLALTLALVAAPPALGSSTLEIAEKGVDWAADTQREIDRLPEYDPGTPEERLARTAANQTQPNRAAGQVVKLRQRIGMTRTVFGASAGARLWPFFGSATLAFQVGWEIGTQLRPLFYEVAPPPPPATAPLLTGYTVTEQGAAMASLWTETLYATEPGFVFDDGTSPAFYTLAAQAPCPLEMPLPALPEGAVLHRVLLEPTGDNCFTNGGWVQSPQEQAIAFSPLLATWPRTYTGQPTNATIPAVDTPMTMPQIRTAIRDEIAANPEDYRDLLAILGDQANVTIPDCSNLSYEACRSALRSAGIIGTIGMTRLTAESEVRSYNENATVTTVPLPGGKINPTKSVRVVVNPEHFTPLTAAEEDLADDIEQNNPQIATGPDPLLSRDRIETVTRTCRQRLALTRLLAEATDLCRTLPILVTASDISQASFHNLEALDAYPQWHLLHRRATSTPRPSWLKDWYVKSANATYSNCYPPDSKPQPVDGAAYECDEFPFAAAREGWNGQTTTPTPSTKWISEHDNRTEGLILQRFHSGWKKGEGEWGGTELGSKSWPGCNIASNPLNDSADQSQGLPDPDSRYVILSMPWFGLPSLGICNGRETPLT